MGFRMSPIQFLFHWRKQKNWGVRTVEATMGFWAQYQFCSASKNEWRGAHGESRNGLLSPMSQYLLQMGVHTESIRWISKRLMGLLRPIPMKRGVYTEYWDTEGKPHGLQYSEPNCYSLLTCTSQQVWMAKPRAHSPSPNLIAGGRRQWQWQSKPNS